MYTPPKCESPLCNFSSLVMRFVQSHPDLEDSAALSLLETQKQAKKQMENEKRSAMRSMTDMKKRLEAFKAAKEQPETGRRGRETNKR